MPISNGNARTFKHPEEVWAMLYMSRKDTTRIRDFFIKEIGIDEAFVTRNVHLTIYHARRIMPGLVPLDEEANIVVYADETRFMVMAPGGENVRPHLDPAKRKVGIRIHKQSIARPAILTYRERLLEFETQDVLGNRKPSTATKSAFGSRYFQPHMTLLEAGSGVDSDLTKIGARFRAHFGCFKFDRFKIKINKFNGLIQSGV